MMHIRITGKQIVIGEALPHRVRERVSTQPNISKPNYAVTPSG
jgi:ribosome-associated translation inhibitor RaiA